MSLRDLGLTVLLLVGCAQSHVAPGEARLDAGALDGGSGAPSAPAGETRCESLTRPEVFSFGAEAECQSRTIELHLEESCDQDLDAFRLGALGVGVRVERSFPGAVDLRTSGCPVGLRRMSDRLCGSCGLLGGGAEDPRTLRLIAIADDGIAEVLLVPERTFDGRLLAPCDLTVEVCFDPEYRPPPWEEE